MTPSSLSIKIKNQNKTITLINDGEVNILKTPGLTEVSFDVLIPQVQYPFAVYPNGWKNAKYYLDAIEKLKTEKKTFQFVVSRTSPSGSVLFDTNLSVSLEDYTIEEEAENGMDLTLSVKLKQYRSYGTKTVQITIKQPGIGTQSTSSSRPSKSSPTVYTVKKGDCLWNICKKYLGDPTKCWEIARINNIKNPNLIYVGQKIRLG
ncbi:peptidoglycan-binding protein [Solibaculum mannosilyticum]|uniref:Peptidoglycan-binding protein n=1 Tax=Solibaculum mannosilyticum TaxID=2780922 RepID=A0A7I8D3Q9_9FIRM|nr:peptidoglycan-binding protein [Solibaculum mannosilyticum]